VHVLISLSQTSIYFLKTNLFLCLFAYRSIPFGLQKGVLLKVWQVDACHHKEILFGFWSSTTMIVKACCSRRNCGGSIFHGSCQHWCVMDNTATFLNIIRKRYFQSWLLSDIECTHIQPPLPESLLMCLRSDHHNWCLESALLGSSLLWSKSQAEAARVEQCLISHKPYLESPSQFFLLWYKWNNKSKILIKN